MGDVTTWICWFRFIPTDSFGGYKKTTANCGENLDLLECRGNQNESVINFISGPSNPSGWVEGKRKISYSAKYASVSSMVIRLEKRNKEASKRRKDLGRRRIQREDGYKNSVFS